MGLYTEVLRLADREYGSLLPRLFLPWLEDESIVSNAHRFKGLLKSTFEAFYDYMMDHPQFRRILNWEQAEGWQTLAKIAAQFEPNDLAQFEAMFSKGKKAGLLRANLDMIVMILLVQQICWSSPNAFPIYQLLLAGKDMSSDGTREHVRKQIVEFLIARVMRRPEGRTRSTTKSSIHK